MDKKECTDFLFSKSTFLTGMASAYNIAGNFYEFNYSSSGDEADNNAIEVDWRMIASDLRKAIESNRIAIDKSSLELVHE